MTTNFFQSTPKIILLVLSTLAVGSRLPCNSLSWERISIGNAAIFGLATKASAEDLKTGPIGSNADAKVKCPLVAKAVKREWNGQWTTISSKESVCGLRPLIKFEPKPQPRPKN